MAGTKGVQPQSIAASAQNYLNNIVARAGKKNEIKTVDVKAKPTADYTQTVAREDLDKLSPYSGLVQLSAVPNVDVKEINATLAEYNCPKVTAHQIASIENGLKNTVIPGMEGARNAATEAHLTSVAPYDKAGEEFSQLFANS